MRYPTTRGLLPESNLSTVLPVVLQLLAGLLLCLGQFLHEFGGILVEILPAGLAAKLNFFAFVGENIRIAHFPELLVGNDACFERIGLLIGFFIRLLRFRIGGEGCERSGQERYRQQSGRDIFNSFHRWNYH